MLTEQGDMNSAARRNGLFYVTDIGFALPTIAAALETRRKVPLLRADVRIVVTDISDEVVKRMRDFLEPRGVSIDMMPKELFSGFDHRLYNKTHVPISALGRFFMLDCVPDIYDRVLYMDGDTWPLGDPLELLEGYLPEGTIAAAEDRSYFYSTEIGATGDKVRSYFSGIGIKASDGYFSSGVLLARSQTWRDICGEAFEFFKDNTSRCVYHDQSALNAVANGRRVRLSPKWNFLTSYWDWNVARDFSPAIAHFCGGAKPWKGSFTPLENFFELYTERFSEISSIGLTTKIWSTEEQKRENEAAARYRAKLNSVFLLRKMSRQARFKNLMETSVIK